MFELFTSRENAFVIIKKDHDKVKELFDQFESAKDLRTKKRIAAEAIMELKIHAEIEEKIFYPSVREEVEDDIMLEADEEHHVAKLLIAELDQMDGSEEHWEAKFTVLAENIRHHIREEEDEMLPQARKVDLDFDALGRKLLAKKQALKKDGVPPSLEEKLMAANKKADSPARNAKKKIASPKAKSKSPKRKSPLRASRKAPAKRTASQAKPARRSAR